eukprot:10153583-Ditylum_brightwellii.AAC.1
MSHEISSCADYMLQFPCLCAIPADALPLHKPEVALPLCSLLCHTGLLGGSPLAWPPLCLRHVQPIS